MSTKNKNIKTYDLESVFNEYRVFLSKANDVKINDLKSELEQLVKAVEEEKETLTQAKERLQKVKNIEKEIAKISVFSDEKQAKVLEDLNKATLTLQEKTNKLDELTATDRSTLTEAQATKLDEKIEKAKEAVNKAHQKVDSVNKSINDNNEKIKTIEEKHEEILTLVKETEVDVILEKPSTDPVDLFNTIIEALNKDIAEKEKEVKDKEAEIAILSKEPIPTIESFKEFLAENKLSTVHAEELFAHINNPEQFDEIAFEDFKMRKMHPKRDYFIKKVVVPTAITSTAIGATIGAIAGSGLVGGTEVMGFIPVSGTPGLTAMATTMTGAVAGLAATPVIIKGKNLITRTYYKLKGKSADKNLTDYTNGTNLNNLSISKLVASIQKTQRKILEASGPRKVILNTINRNRIHQIEAYTKELLRKYIEIDNDENIDNKVKAEELKPIYELLDNIQDFISNDVAEAKTHALITCKETKKNHTHKMMIENVDIYANLKIYLERIAQISNEYDNSKEQMKQAKRTTNNLGQKKEEAYKIINGERLISRMVNFETKYGKYFNTEDDLDIDAEPVEIIPPTAPTKPNFAPKPELKVVSASTSDDGEKVILELEDGKKLEITASKIDASKKIATAKASKSKFSITYSDGTKQEIAKTTKVSSEVSSTRHLIAASLEDEEYVQAWIDQDGYSRQTINALRNKLKDWCEAENASTHESPVLVLKGKVKELYTAIINEDIHNAQEELGIE